MKLSGRRSSQIGIITFFAATRLAWATLPAGLITPEGGMIVDWPSGAASQQPTVYTSADLTHVRKISSTEVDPMTGKATQWEGISLGDLLDRAMKPMTNDQKAQIDLVVLKSGEGGESAAEALIPRSFIVKYPVMLANRRDHKPLSNFESVAPWTSKSKTKEEGLPLETYFLKGVVQVELANYRERFGNVFLKNRKEPTALRGEKIFIQNCMSCHNSAKGEKGITEARRFIDSHPTVAGSPKLNEREQRSLKTYLETYQAENAQK
jgi:hypothetical protein